MRQRAQTVPGYATATVESALSPGVYDRIDIGTVPPPPLIHTQPLINYQTPCVVQ